MAYDQAHAAKDADRLKELLLKTPLFEQFQKRPDCLHVDVVDEGWFNLRLSNFPGLDTDRVSRPRDFEAVELPGVELTGGRIASGSPEGIMVQYGYRIVPHDADIEVCTSPNNG